MPQADGTSLCRRSFWWGVALVLTVMAVIGAIAARFCYFQAKLAATEPVAIRAYAAENATLRTRDSGQVREQPRMVVIGDSRARSIRLTELEPSWEVVNRGVAGETSAQLLLRFDRDSTALKPNLVVIQSGINDLVAGMGSDALAPVITQQTAENLKLMAERAAMDGSAVIVTTIIPPARPNLLRRLVWSEDIRTEVAKANDTLLSWQAPPGVTVLNLSVSFSSPTTLAAEFAKDTLHLNEAGNAVLARELTAVIRSTNLTMKR